MLHKVCKTPVPDIADLQKPVGNTKQDTRRRFLSRRLQRIGRIIEFVNDNAAGAVNHALGNVDARIVVATELLLKRGKGLLEHV